MSDKAFYISQLINKQLREELSPTEQTELNDWLDLSITNRELYEQLNNENWVCAELEKFGQYTGNSEAVFNLVNDNVGVKVRTLIKRIAIAASIILILGISSYFIFFNESFKQDQTVVNVLPDDIKAPESNRAMITLSDGTTVYLDSVSNGTLASQAGVNVIKLEDGQIVYDGVSQEQIAYNTLHNPRGSKVIDMTLSDGSRVWLNAGSSVTYPVAFVGSERKVAIAGEAYFEITHNTSQPFKVTKDDLEVVVLGTHFNVNAYYDEADIKVTLLEGSVKVSTTKQQNNSTILKPGQQAQITLNSKISTLNADLEEVIAWKNGKFQFGAKTDIATIMRQIARWYDVDVVYEGAMPKQQFGGEMPRNSNLSQVLEILRTSGVKFTIVGRTVMLKT